MGFESGSRKRRRVETVNGNDAATGDVVNVIVTIWVDVFTDDVPNGNDAATEMTQMELDDVKNLAGKTLVVGFSSTDTVKDLRNKIHLSESIPVEYQPSSLRFKGRHLEDDHSLASYGIKKQDDINWDLGNIGAC